VWSRGYAQDARQGYSTEEQLCKALYNMIESAAVLLTYNKDVLIAFKEARERTKTELELSTASFGLSLWAGYSAFWTTVAISTNSSILPLAAWTLGDVLGLALLEVPVLMTTSVTTTLWWCPPIAVAAGIGAVGFSLVAWKKNKERGNYNAKIKYHEASKYSLPEYHKHWRKLTWWQ
jgi:hypothetical protein